MDTNIARAVQIALLGEVPPTLRFLYVSYTEKVLRFEAVFTDDASDEHLECASVACTEILASVAIDTELIEIIERDNLRAWKIGNGDNLMYLRYGELDRD